MEVWVEASVYWMREREGTDVVFKCPLTETAIIFCRFGIRHSRVVRFDDTASISSQKDVGFNIIYHTAG